ncbi:hypothetical protein GQX74_001206 [Glossina fuscipes]|nr:hypothetical protein GQX74_001206 [Glossina fuscipes]
MSVFPLTTMLIKKYNAETESYSTASLIIRSPSACTTGHSTSNVPILWRKKYLLSLNPKLNYRPPQLCETPNRNTRQTETTTPELGEFVKNAVETSTPGVNRKLPVQEMEKDNDAILMANRPKRWRLSGLSRTRTSSKK